jgi:peptidase M48-like protein
MIAAIVVAVAVTGAFAWAGPRLAVVASPPTAVRLLVAASVVVAGCGAFVLAVVSFIGAAQLGEVAEEGPWSPATVHSMSPISDTAAVIAGALLLPAIGLAAIYVVRTIRAIWTTHRVCHGLPSAGSLLVVNAAQPEAFTTAGVAGRIVITTGLLRALDRQQRKALLAHERSHLQHRHPWWTITADLTAAVNPLLRPTARAIRQLCERWADEDAAAETSRDTVADTIGHVALLVSRRPRPAVLAAAGGCVTARVRAMQSPAPRRRTLPSVLIVAMAIVMIGSTVVVENRTETLFENALRQDAAASALGGHASSGGPQR